MAPPDPTALRDHALAQLARGDLAQAGPTLDALRAAPALPPHLAVWSLLLDAARAVAAREFAAALRVREALGDRPLDPVAERLRLHLDGAIALAGHGDSGEAFAAVVAAGAAAAGPDDLRAAAIAAAGFAGRRFALEKSTLADEEPLPALRLAARLWLAALG